MRIVHKIILLSTITIILAIMFCGCTKKTNSDVQITNTDEDTEGRIVVTVVDKDTKKPVSDAKITIIGVDNTYKTDDKGLSPDITLKINKDIYRKYGGELWKKAPSGSVTVLVSKDDYKDYVMFNKAIYPGYSSNRLNVAMEKLSKKDKQKFVTDIEQPHEVWIQELLEYCSDMKEEKEGNGEGKVTIDIKDNNSKPVDGVTIIIPELGIKGITDKTGKVVLKPGLDKEVFDVYPVKKDYMEYTIVALKEGYTPDILLNAAIHKEKDNNISFKLKASKGQGQNEFVVKLQPFDSAWVQKLIDNYKKADTE